MKPTTPPAQDDVLISSPELHLPLNKPVKMLLRSKDVNHQFAVPQFRVKMDMVPGMVTYFWFTPTRTGTFDALCEQLCGMAHFAMRGRVVVDEQAALRQVAGAVPDVRAAAGGDGGRSAGGRGAVRDLHRLSRRAGRRQSRAECAQARRPGQLVPDPAAQGFPRRACAAAHEDDTFGRQMVPFASMLADEQALRDVVAYIATLPEQRPEATVLGNPDKGKARYCHTARPVTAPTARAYGPPRAAPGEHERLVHGAAAGKLPQGHPRLAPAGFLWRADGVDGACRRRRRSRARPARLRAHAVTQGRVRRR